MTLFSIEAATALRFWGRDKPPEEIGRGLGLKSSRRQRFGHAQRLGSPRDLRLIVHERNKKLWNSRRQRIGERADASMMDRRRTARIEHGMGDGWRDAHAV